MDTQAELVRLEIPALPAFVGVARTVVVAIATSLDGIDDDRLEDLRIAVSEACTNAVESQGDGDTRQRVVLRCLLDGQRLEIRIEDAAAGIDPDDVPPPGEPGLELPDAERAWGVQLIQALVDEVRFDGPGDRTVTLIMQLDQSDGVGPEA
jgi:serine/threonine-protein kinase RsbW